MPEAPGGPAFEPDGRAGPGDEGGWGSPVPAEYGSLRSARPAAPAGASQAEAREAREGPEAASAAPETTLQARVASVLRRLQGDPAPTNGNAAGAAGAAGAPSRPPTADGWSGLPPADMAVTAAVPVIRPGEPAPATGIDPAELGPGLVGRDAVLGGRHRRGRRPVRVRSRATIRHLDILTVAKVAVVFWLVILIALVVASFMLWVFADAFGSLPSIEKSIRTLFSLKSFTLHPGTVAGYTAAAGVVVAIAGTIATVLCALIYNLIADVVGGVRVELESFSAD